MDELDIKSLEDAVIQAEMNLHGARAQEAAIQHRIDVLEPARMRTLVKMLIDVLEPARMRTLVKMLNEYKEATASAIVALGHAKAELLSARGKVEK